DGGAGGFDSLVIEGQHASVRTSATGPNSGTVTVDGTPIAYAGLEPITLGGTVADVTVTGSSGDDDILIHHDPSVAGNIEVKTTTGSMESVSFAPPTASLPDTGGGGRDTVPLGDDLAIPGANLTIAAASIVVSPLVTVNAGAGDVTFTAADPQAGSSSLGIWTATAAASISLTGGAALIGRNIDLSATSSATPSPATDTHVAVNASSTAAVEIVDSTVTATGNLSLTASSAVNSTASAAGDAGHSATGTDAAVAGSTVASTATSRIAGTSTVSATGSLGVSATNTVVAATTGDASTAPGGAG